VFCVLFWSFYHFHEYHFLKAILSWILYEK
jgi:hypothetical protein